VEGYCSLILGVVHIVFQWNKYKISPGQSLALF